MAALVLLDSTRADAQESTTTTEPDVVETTTTTEAEEPASTTTTDPPASTTTTEPEPPEELPGQLPLFEEPATVTTGDAVMVTLLVCLAAGSLFARSVFR